MASLSEIPSRCSKERKEKERREELTKETKGKKRIRHGLGEYFLLLWTDSGSFCLKQHPPSWGVLLSGDLALILNISNILCHFERLHLIAFQAGQECEGLGTPG